MPGSWGRCRCKNRAVQDCRVSKAQFGRCDGPVVWILTKEAQRLEDGSRRGSAAEHANRPVFVTLQAC